MRRTTWILAVALLFVSVGSASAHAQHVPSYEGWQADVRQVTAPIVPWLQQREAQGGENLAIVLDIDNTALETYYNPEQPNKPVREVAHWARANGFAVLFATVRGSSIRSSTLEQLHRAGYVVDGLCMRLGQTNYTKQRCRREYTEAGYTITANIGNRDIDMRDGDYEKGFLLPHYGESLD